MEVYRRQHRRFLRLPGVIRVGVGLGARGSGEDRTHHSEACIVITVENKGRFQAGHHFPRRIEGVRVDVQEGVHARTKALRAGQYIRGDGDEGEYGLIGLIARDGNDDPVGVTAMHALVRETPNVHVVDGSVQVAAATTWNGKYTPIGSVRWGIFNENADIALVDLSVDAIATQTVDQSAFLEFPPESGVTTGQEVVLEYAPGAGVSGYVSSVLSAGDFDTDCGRMPFSGLIEFTMAADVEDGWSGSVLYGANSRAPVALVSFGSPHGVAPHLAYGWLLKDALSSIAVLDQY